jgi:ABC-type uncharacterized transport system YnjBCD substrate-binding protein
MGSSFVNKIQSQRTIDSGYFKSLKEPTIFMKELTKKNWQFFGRLINFFFFKFNNCDYYIKIGYLKILGTNE